ncbi:MAG: N-acetylneuraminic acid synthase [Nitrospinae bacterium RIFCSPLOWO2_12_39_16]|nr:MAG: N-acetylneuraminic acid synthase [Nitrospinae bacterium RIFCSPLOWO2_12_39_16]
MNRDFLEDLFILEMTNNHQGDVNRGLEIIRQFSRIVRFNNVRAAIKLQFRNFDTFIHKDFVDREDIYYIKRIKNTKLSVEDYVALVEGIKKSGCIPLATPFDEKSVDLIEDLNLPVIKVASSGCNDWMLIERIAKARKPVVISIGGMSLKDMDDMVTFFENRNIPLSICHCIAAYPTEDSELQLNQIDFLKRRYPNHVIGLSVHEYRDWQSSIIAGYAKGARLFERHIDINTDGFKVASYSSLPEQIDVWFKAWHHARLICGNSAENRLLPIEKETNYLNSYIRGIYAKRDIQAGEMLSEGDIYLSVPLLKGQISCRELMLGRSGHKVIKHIGVNQPIMIDSVDTPYADNESLMKVIYERGLDPSETCKSNNKDQLRQLRG